MDCLDDSISNLLLIRNLSKESSPRVRYFTTFWSSFYL